jgi:hypothetical protein
MRIADPILIARRFDFVRETLGPNRGAWVQHIQRAVHLHPGEPWCMAFVWLVFDIAYAGHSPLFQTGSCHACLLAARDKGWEVNDPQAGDLYFYLEGDHAQHVGIVTQADPLIGIAGNTSADGQSSNGDGVHEHGISGRMTFVRVPR